MAGKVMPRAVRRSASARFRSAQPVVALLRRIRADELDVVAAWLAYTTLLSLVPLVALVLVLERIGRGRGRHAGPQLMPPPRRPDLDRPIAPRPAC